MGAQNATASPDPGIPLLNRAVAESAAATAILLDRDAWPTSAIGHLLAGFGAVIDAVAPSEDGDLADRVARAKLPVLSEADRARLAALLRTLRDAATDRPDSVAQRDLRWASRVLHNVSVALLRQRGGRIGMARWAAVGAAAVVAIAGLTWLASATEIGGEVSGTGWLARYYPEPDFGGEPVIRYDPAIDFDWLGEAPHDDVPADRYTVRWDTCLHLSEPDTIELRIGSDDGSRVFVDGEQVLDNWRDQAGNWATHAASLGAGVHHIRVEYYENGGNALAILQMKTPAGPVPAEWIRPPRLRGGDVACEQ